MATRKSGIVRIHKDLISEIEKVRKEAVMRKNREKIFTADELNKFLDVHVSTVHNYLRELEKAGKVECIRYTEYGNCWWRSK